jgi:hypothetical protein
MSRFRRSPGRRRVVRGSDGEDDGDDATPNTRGDECADVEHRAHRLGPLEPFAPLWQRVAMDRLGSKMRRDLPELSAAGLIVAGLMVAPSAPFCCWVEYIRGRQATANPQRPVPAPVGCLLAARAAAAAAAGGDRNVEKLGACRTTCRDVVGLNKKEE